jgi:rare lipoprotein A
MTKRRRARVGARALMIGIPASAAAVGAGHALAAPAPEPLQIGLRSEHVAYGHDVAVTGTEAPSDAGNSVVLQFAPRGATAWRALDTTTVGGGGRFRLTGVLERSGEVRAVDATSAMTALVASSDPAPLGTTSRSMAVDVAPAVRVHRHSMAVLAGQTVRVRGRLLPALAGRKVSLQARQNGQWRTLATARTGSEGRFVLRYVTGSPGQEQIRVHFAGDQLNGRAAVRAGEMTVYREAEASWYNDGGDTACGFHAYYGVANRTLRCGTKVSFQYNGRSVTATVDDRGPYVAGRDWDLNQNTAAALGFGGVGTVRSSQ